MKAMCLTERRGVGHRRHPQALGNGRWATQWVLRRGVGHGRHPQGVPLPGLNPRVPMQWTAALLGAALLVGCHTLSSTVDGTLDAATTDSEDAATSPDTEPDSETDAPDDIVDEDVALDDSDDAADSDADDGDALLVDAVDEDVQVDTGPDGPIGPNTCGDGWRDPVWEECDDGLDPLAGTYDSACTSDCIVLDRLVAIDAGSKVADRWLGLGRHPVAGGAYGHAVVVTELAGPAGDEVRVATYTFSSFGERLGARSWGNVPVEADPVVAALPNGDYAVAYASFDDTGDGVRIALARVSKDGSSVEQKGTVNTTKVFSQHSPDVLWTGKRLVVGWEDESTIRRRVCRKEFNADLQPVSGEVCTSTLDAATRVSLATLNGERVTSYRVDRSETSIFQVDLPSGAVFATEPVWSPAFDETLALAELDGCTMLGVYVDGNDVMRAVVFDDTGAALGPPVVLGEPRWRPALAMTADGAYLAWWEPSAVPHGSVGWDPNAEEVWLQRLSWNGSVLDVSSKPIPLPRTTLHRLGDQVMPSLASVPLWPTGALVAAWTDLSGGNYAGQVAHADVLLELIPTPVIRTMGGY